MVEKNPKNPALVGILTTWRAVTHQGLTRNQNEDAHLVANRVEIKNDEETLRYLFAVADGLGGHHGGAIASRMALESVKEKFHNWNKGDAHSLVMQSLRHANQKIFMTAQSEPKLFNKMQTTITVVVLEQDSMIVGHVGDCRLYRVRNGHIKLLTKDHTMANELLRFHLISQEQANNHHGRHQLTRSVGGDPFLNIDMVCEKIESGDTYLLCSDGLWSELHQEELKFAMQENDIIVACDKLVGYALRSGASDNITAILFRIGVISKKSHKKSCNSILNMITRIFEKIL